MIRLAIPWTAIRPPKRTLRVRLTLLYAALFCACAVAVGAIAEIFKPNFLIHTSAKAAPPGIAHAVCHTRCVTTGSPSGGIFGGLGSFIEGGATAHNVGGGLALLAILVVVAMGAGWLISGRMLRPLRSITASARAISATNLHQRLGIGGPGDEFTELGGTLDDLFARLEASFESQRRFVANASHELRTPLAAERTLLQVALDDPDASSGTLRAACLEALDLGQQQEQLIDALLTLASSERGLDRWQPVDLAAITDQVLRDRQDEAQRLGIRIEPALGAAAATGDASLIESLITNLVDNALHHNIPGGSAVVLTANNGGQATLTVTNTGQPVPQADVDRLFEPFQRLGSERLHHTGGHGLGLAIVRAITTAHGADLSVRPRPSGGLSVEVSFPDPTSHSDRA